MSNFQKGLIFEIDQDGKVLEVKRNDFAFSFTEGAIFLMVDPSSIGKSLTFLKTLINEGTAVGWELNVKVDDSLIGLFFSSFKTGDKYIVLGSANLTHSRRLMEDVMTMYPENESELQMTAKENIAAWAKMGEGEITFNNLTEVNNEMANMQRELAKKNKELFILNDALKQKNQELDHFAYMVSHDLKAPLVSVSSLVDILKRHFGENVDSQTEKIFELLKEQSVRMSSLIEGILAYSRSIEIEGHVKEFNLQEMIKESIASLVVPDSVKITVPEKLPDLNCNYIQLVQVFSNLLGNAIKYHDKHAVNIELQIEPVKSNWLRYTVIDDGPGIPEKYHDKLFNMFQTANTIKRADSSGIGLAIAKKLVEHNGGEIGFNSIEGKGSKFWFTWPVNAEIV